MGGDTYYCLPGLGQRYSGPSNLSVPNGGVAWDRDRLKNPNDIRTGHLQPPQELSSTVISTASRLKSKNIDQGAWTAPRLMEVMSTRTTRGHSCVLCQQRKVKCDGKRPCSTCLRSGDECNSGVRNKPPRARQRLNRTGARVDDLLLRLKQCEDALQAHEITVDDEPAPAPVTSSQNTQGQMIVKGGDSRYVDKYDPVIHPGRKDCLTERSYPAPFGKGSLMRYKPTLHSCSRTGD